MPTSFKDKIRLFLVCSLKAAQKVASCQSQILGHQRLPKVAQFALFSHEFSIYAIAYMYGNYGGDRQRDIHTDTQTDTG